MPGAGSFCQCPLSEAGHSGRAGALLSQAREAMAPVVSETGGRIVHLLPQDWDHHCVCLLALSLFML